MSQQKRPSTKYYDVCDLCGKPVDTYGHVDWSVMNIGHRKAEPQPAERSWFKFLRKGYGDRESGAPTGDRRSWTWDFHGECLVRALMPLVTDEARRTAREEIEDAERIRPAQT